MAKSKKVTVKKAQVEVPVEASGSSGGGVPLTSAASGTVGEPAVAQGNASGSTADPGKRGRARKEKVVEAPTVKWARRLKRWQAKAEAQGVDARGLMKEALAD